MKSLQNLSFRSCCKCEELLLMLAAAVSLFKDSPAEDEERFVPGSSFSRGCFFSPPPWRHPGVLFPWRRGSCCSWRTGAPVQSGGCSCCINTVSLCLQREREAEPAGCLALDWRNKSGRGGGGLFLRNALKPRQGKRGSDARRRAQFQLPRRTDLSALLASLLFPTPTRSSSSSCQRQPGLFCFDTGLPGQLLPSQEKQQRLIRHDDNCIMLRIIARDCSR
nr:PREDICTED: uncharacterized protein LOC103278421 [Anolis carolinensis]|eukprot:XP_008106124.1 PREDICTED: uncharacterized protein LOC103278421 [Anolis carolinensis]